MKMILETNLDNNSINVDQINHWMTTNGYCPDCGESIKDCICCKLK